MDRILPAKPASYWQLLQASLKLYRAGFKNVLLLSLFLSIVVFVPRFLSNLIGQDIFYNLSPLSWHRLWLVLIDLVALIFFIAILWHLHVCTRRHEPIKEDLSIGFKKFISTAVATFIASAIISAASLIIYGAQLFFRNLPMIAAHGLAIYIILPIFIIESVLLLYLATLFILIAPIIATQKRGIVEGLVHCINITWKHAWRVFSLQITPWVVYLCLILILKYVLQLDIHLYFAGNRPHSLPGTLVNLIVFLFFIPWVAAIELVQLHDLELR